MAAAKRAEPVRQRFVSDGLFASETEQAQLQYMEQMYGTINLLNAELENERRNRAALEAAARPATYSSTTEYSSLEDAVGEFDEPSGYLVSHTPVTPSYTPRKLRTVPSPPSQPPQTQYRVARPPVSPRSVVKDQDQELCATLGKNAELRIRSRDMERTVEKTELELELAQEKLRALLKEKLSWQKELKDIRAQVVEEKMRQVDLFREVEAAKRHFAAELEAAEQELQAVQGENAQLRTHVAEMKAQMNFQTRKMEDMTRQAQDEKARHQDEKQKLRDKVNDLEVSIRLLQKDRALSPLELSLRKTAILGSDNTGAIEAEQIETQSRILELENLLAHSQQYQARQEERDSDSKADGKEVTPLAEDDAKLLEDVGDTNSDEKEEPLAEDAKCPGDLDSKAQDTSNVEDEEKYGVKGSTDEVVDFKEKEHTAAVVDDFMLSVGCAEQEEVVEIPSAVDEADIVEANDVVHNEEPPETEGDALCPAVEERTEGDALCPAVEERAEARSSTDAEETESPVFIVDVSAENLRVDDARSPLDNDAVGIAGTKAPVDLQDTRASNTSIGETEVEDDRPINTKTTDDEAVIEVPLNEDEIKTQTSLEADVSLMQSEETHEELAKTHLLLLIFQLHMMLLLRNQLWNLLSFPVAQPTK
eukprot:jgi/Phyca11/19555/fgenesh1_pg.PHYCAscaffold_49_\